MMNDDDSGCMSLAEIPRQAKAREKSTFAIILYAKVSSSVRRGEAKTCNHYR